MSCFSTSSLRSSQLNSNRTCSECGSEVLDWQGSCREIIHVAVRLCTLLHQLEDPGLAIGKFLQPHSTCHLASQFAWLQLLFVIATSPQLLFVEHSRMRDQQVQMQHEEWADGQDYQDVEGPKIGGGDKGLWLVPRLLGGSHLSERQVYRVWSIEHVIKTNRFKLYGTTAINSWAMHINLQQITK